MNASNIASLNQFISLHHLQTTDTILLFDASIAFYQQDSIHTIQSQVQVITLSDSTVLYVFEFLKSCYSMSEMYSTAYYRFNTGQDGKLEITDSNSDKPFVITIIPVGNVSV